MTPHWWCTSDTHFGHKKILLPEYDGRPFSSIEEHDETIVERWNSVVQPHDNVIHAGDLSFLSPAKTHSIVSRLNGNIHLFCGNHDYEQAIQKIEYLFHSIKESGMIKFNFEDVDYDIFVSHHPHLLWPKSHYGSINIHGHTHGTMLHKWKEGFRRFDVSTNANNYTPVSLSEIVKQLRDVVPVQVDNHEFRPRRVDKN